MKPETILDTGRRHIDSIMERNGFTSSAVETGSGSGGEFAQITYSNHGKRFSISYRFSLGCVEYSMNGVKLSHEEFKKGIDKQGKYPGFSDDPLAGFRELADDLEQFGSLFFQASDSDFRLIAERAERSGKGIEAI